MTPVETDRLLLRAFRPDDRGSLHRYASHREVTRCLLWGPNTPGEARCFIRRTAPERGQEWIG